MEKDEQKELFVYVCRECSGCPPCYLVMEEEPVLNLGRCPFEQIRRAEWSLHNGKQ